MQSHTTIRICVLIIITGKKIHRTADIHIKVNKLTLYYRNLLQFSRVHIEYRSDEKIIIISQTFADYAEIGKRLSDPDHAVQN